MPPEYDNFSRYDLTKRLEQVRDTVLVETDSPQDQVEKAYEKSQSFVDSSFDFYEGKKDLGSRIGRAFVVPMRSDRLDDSYASESIPFYPLLDPKRFGVTSEVRMRTMYGLPPTVLDIYGKSANPSEKGALVLSPLYTDMLKDPQDMEQTLRMLKVVDKVLEETAKFVHLKLGADYAGLGAILPSPSLTNFGRKLRAIDGMGNLTTTTGHGGTVYMIGQTALSVLRNNHVNASERIGVLGGAGSIGWSSIQALRKMAPDHQIHAFDKREERMHNLLDNKPELGRVAIAGSIADVLMQNKLIVSAITERIDLEDPPYRDIDFNGVVWIDDSQPGSVDRQQLEARGGHVVWVAGQDKSDNGFMTKDGYYSDNIGYNYGDTSGLYGETTEFACGLEAAVVAASQKPENAVGGPVQFEDVERIGELFDQYGVAIAPFQSFGQKVDLPTV